MKYHGSYRFCHMPELPYLMFHVLCAFLHMSYLYIYVHTYMYICSVFAFGFAFGLERFKVKTHAYAFPISLPIGSIRFGLWTLVPAHLGTQRCLLLCVYHRLSKHPQKRCVSCANSYYIHLHVWENYAK